MSSLSTGGSDGIPRSSAGSMMTISPLSAAVSIRFGGGEVGNSGGGESGRLGRDVDEEDLKLESSIGASKLSGASKMVAVVFLFSGMVPSASMTTAAFASVGASLTLEVCISRGSGSDIRLSNSWRFFFHPSLLL